MHNSTLSTGHTETVEWAMKVLKQTEINITVVVETPWSNALKINTLQGPVYLKQTPPDLFIEADIIQKCRNLSNITDIPEVIAANKNLNCFLMKSCGDASLRTVFDGHLDVVLLVLGLQIYRRMQQATAPHVDSFLQAGVPDWRLERFPKLYLHLISDEEFLQTYGLDTTQIKILQESVGKVEMACQALSEYGIPECLNHSDFHENNMVFSNATKKVSIIDLGETAIDHPFFVLAAFFKVTCARYNIESSSTVYQKLYDTCFDGWLDDKQNMMRVVELINRLLPVYWIFAQRRFLDAIHLPYDVDNPLSVKQHGKINKGFLLFIENVGTNDGKF